jgi:hypothetical protein
MSGVFENVTAAQELCQRAFDCNSERAARKGGARDTNGGACLEVAQPFEVDDADELALGVDQTALLKS